MDAKDTLTVAVLCHNYGWHLASCLSSIVSQPIRPSILIINDASTDDTADVINTWQLSYPEIRSVTTDNPHLCSGARNIALNHCETPYLVTFDADDLLGGNYMEKVIEAMGDNPCADVLGVRNTTRHEDGHTTRGFLRMPKWPEILAGNCISAASVMLTQAVRDIGGWDASLKGASDWDLWIRGAKAGWEFALIDEPLYFYNIHEGQTGNRIDFDQAERDMLAKYH